MIPKSKLGCLLTLLAIALVFGLLMWLVILPAMKLQGDPNASGPDIHRVENGKEWTSEKRGCVSDQLFVKLDKPPQHPLDPALAVAKLGLGKIKAELRDYTALMVKQEEVNGKLLGEEFLRVKVRHADAANSINKAFYVRHVKPENMAGQEAIWVQNENDGKLIGHGSGLARLIKVNLDPEGMLAKRGNRYPITELGIETLMMRMLERGKNSRTDADCKVEYDRSLKIDGNACTLITITHPQEKEGLDFHIAKIYIDDDLDLPVGYEGYWWPDDEGGPAKLIERYFYRELQLNPGLKDLDFDPENPDYDYP